MEFNLADLFELVADRVPDRLALVAGDRRLTFGELDERATRFANYLVDIVFPTVTEPSGPPPTPTTAASPPPPTSTT